MGEENSEVPTKEPEKQEEKSEKQDPGDEIRKANLPQELKDLLLEDISSHLKARVIIDDVNELDYMRKRDAGELPKDEKTEKK